MLGLHYNSRLGLGSGFLIARKENNITNGPQMVLTPSLINGQADPAVTASAVLSVV